MDHARDRLADAAADVVGRMAADGASLVATAAGGGAGAVAALAGTPGASRVLLEGLVPHAREAVDRLLGGKQESYCSSRASRRLAMAAWARARALGAPAGGALGAAVTASLATVRPKQGDHRAVVAVQSLAATAVHSLTFSKGLRTRAAEEDVAAWLLLAAVAAECGTPVPLPERPALQPDEEIVVQRVVAPAPWRALLAGDRRGVSAVDGDAPGGTPGRLLFPGSFDPLHDGHRGMATVAARIVGREVEYELSIENVDKPALDYVEIAARQARFVGAALWLTRTATFVEKTALFPRAFFVLGADTFTRLWDRRYYGGSAAAADDAVRRIAASVAGLIVFGRLQDGAFVSADRPDTPAPLRTVARFVTEEEFRCDLSSTQLRRAGAAS